MKRFLLITVAALTLATIGGCQKEDAKKTIMVNVTFNGASAYPSAVMLYDYTEAITFDKGYSSACYFGDHLELKLADGSIVKPKYVGNTTGVNTFENVENGKYIAIAMYKPNGFTFPNYYFYGYHIIETTSAIVSFNFNFKNDSKRGEFIEY